MPLNVSFLSLMSLQTKPKLAFRLRSAFRLLFSGNSFVIVVSKIPALHLPCFSGQTEITFHQQICSGSKMM